MAARTRTGEKNLVTCMREALLSSYPGQCIGLGGVFHMAAGTAKFHVMPDFSPCPIDSEEKVGKHF